MADGWSDDDNWDSPPETGTAPVKLRGFGRGKPSNQQANEVGGLADKLKDSFKPKAGTDNWSDDEDDKGSSGARNFGYQNNDRGGFGSRRGRSGGFGGQDRGGIGCHKCGEEGHFARECPNSGGGRGDDSRSKGCFKCGEEGHFARECPSSEGSDRGFRRGGFGSRSGDSRGNFGRPVRKEKDDSDWSDDSGKPGSGNRGDSFRSSRGRFDNPRGGFGQSRNNFPDRNNSRGFRRESDEDKSRNGDGDNWGIRDGGGRGGFGKPRGGGFGGDRGDSGRRGGSTNGFGGQGSGCRKCGEEGHFARECPKAGEGGEKPRENYVPPDLGDDDSLFKMGIHQGINFDKYDNIAVEVSGKDRVRPIAAFEDAGLKPTFLQNVQRAGYIKPTPIQKHAIPSILAGRDLMACAQTGSGKTAAFVLPVLSGMIDSGVQSSAFSEVQTPQALVVAPTRELALQIYTEARKFASRTVVRAVVVYGGTSVGHQLRQLESGANLVVGTPGRLLDFVERGKINLSKIKYLILDEADRMLDMGFEPSIRKLVEDFNMPSKTERQTLMFSATFKEEIQTLAADFLNEYLFIAVGIVGGACSDVEQAFLEVDHLEKREYLCDMLDASKNSRVLVFVGQKRNADFLASFLSQSGYKTTSLHGDRLQREREEALRAFKSGTSTVMIATNVAARGLDIPDVAHVINYDLPEDIDEYVHRIGRTGRCGNLGKATSFYNHATDSHLANSLVRILGESTQETPDWLEAYARSSASTGGRIGGRFGGKDIRRRGKFENGGDRHNGQHDSYGAEPVDDDEDW